MSDVPAVVTLVAGDHAIVAMVFLGHLRELTVPLDDLNPTIGD